MQRITQSLRPTATLTHTEIDTKDSIHDIENYIRSRIESRPIDSEDILSWDELVNNLLSKSNACFLWVRLVLDELEEVYSNEGIARTVNSIPEGMIPYYERTVQTMAEKKEKHIAKAVLMWVVASSRKLHVSELAQALRLDIKTILPSAKSAIEGLCGQLVNVDGNTDLVSLVHPTVREFLLSESAGDFRVRKAHAHERIVIACLDLLCSAEMQPPRSQRQILSRDLKRPRPSALLEYAITQFSEHVYLTSSETDQLLIALDRFFKTNVLSWVEAIASRGDIHTLIRASRNLKAYLDRRAKYCPPLNTEVQNLGAWSTDLSQIATRFGATLLDTPTSIYFLIPPLCPSTSAICQRFGKRPDGLTTLGCVESTWNDCIASVRFDEDATPSTVSCGESLVAVGMDSGNIDLYDYRSCQKVGRFEAGSPVDMVHLTEKSVVFCTARNLSVMDREGNVLWQTRLRFGCILLTSTPESVIIVSQHGHVMTWDIATGDLLEDQAFACKQPDGEGGTTTLWKAPHVAALSNDLEIVAMGFRAAATCVYDVASGDLICWALDERNRLVSALLFNPSPNVSLLLVIFSDHELVLYETWSGGIVGSRTTSSKAGVLSATVSPDGRTLATMDTLGVLQIWDFESLDLLYHVSTSSTFFCMLTFTSDSSSVMDIVDGGMRLWSPAVLVRKNNEDDQSISDGAANIQPIEGEFEARRNATITAFCAHPLLPLVFAGKQNGDVLAYSTKTGKQIAVLYNHGNRATILGLAASQGNLIASSDDNGVVQVWNLGKGQLISLDGQTLVLKTYVRSRIRQVCFSGSGRYLLVASETTDTIYGAADGSLLTTLPVTPQDRKTWRWLDSHPDEKGDHMFLLSDNTIIKFDLPSMTRSIIAKLEFPAGSQVAGSDIKIGLIHPRSKTLVVSSQALTGYATSSSTFLFNIDRLANPPHTLDGESGAQASHDLQEIHTLTGSLVKDCKRFIGVHERTNKLVFLHRSSWVCTVDRDGLLSENRQYTQHFFVPDENVSVMHDTPPISTRDNSIVFCRHSELLVVKNGFNYEQARSFD